MNVRWEMFGKYFGFPKCCRKAFEKSKEDWELRCKAGELNGVGTGFVPCAWHAQLVVAGKVRLQDLIRNRLCPLPFPSDGMRTRTDAEEVLVRYARELSP